MVWSTKSKSWNIKILAGLKDAQKRDRYISMLRKNILEAVCAQRDSKAIFVFGNQRSGTSMLMVAFHRHPDIIVYDEHRDNKAFHNYRIKSFEKINEIVMQSSFPAVCFKPICDSHLISEFQANIPAAHFIWIYRDFRDVANSTLRKFANATRAIILICEGKPGGGWLEESVSDYMRDILQSVYKKGLSRFDLCCLVWWVRNQVLMDSPILNSNDLSVIKYETLVTRPDNVMNWLFKRIDFPYDARINQRMNSGSIRRNPYPPMNLEVANLCHELMRKIDVLFQKSFSDSKP
jgi:hypothetical protein